MKKQQSKQVQDMVFTQLDGLKALVENTLKEWDETNVPLNFLHEAILKAKISPRKQKVKAAKDFFLKFNKTLTVMEKLCKQNAEAMNAKHVPLTVFNLFLDRVKEAFTEGLNQTHKS